MSSSRALDSLISTAQPPLEVHPINIAGEAREKSEEAVEGENDYLEANTVGSTQGRGRSLGGRIYPPDATSGIEEVHSNRRKVSKSLPSVNIKPSDSLFAGSIFGRRMINTVSGKSIYDVCPNETTIGISRRSFPSTISWSIVWLDNSSGEDSLVFAYDEYDKPDKVNPPGGEIMLAIFNSSLNASSFFILADNVTVVLLIHSIVRNCSSLLSSTTNSAAKVLPVPYSNCSTTGSGEAIQYYRAGSVVLGLEGYNNTAFYNGGSLNAPMSTLPSGIDTALLCCMNAAIGGELLLLDGYGHQAAGFGCVVLIWVYWFWYMNTHRDRPRI